MDETDASGIGQKAWISYDVWVLGTECSLDELVNRYLAVFER